MDPQNKKVTVIVVSVIVFLCLLAIGLSTVEIRPFNIFILMRMPLILLTFPVFVLGLVCGYFLGRARNRQE